MPNLLLTMWDTIKSSNIGILVAAGLGMFAIIGGLSMLSYCRTSPYTQTVGRIIAMWPAVVHPPFR